MKAIKMSLVNNDHKVETRVSVDNGNTESLADFLRKVQMDMIPGETAFLEIENQGAAPFRLMVERPA